MGRNQKIPDVKRMGLFFDFVRPGLSEASSRKSFSSTLQKIKENKKTLTIYLLES